MKLPSLSVTVTSTATRSVWSFIGWSPRCPIAGAVMASAVKTLNKTTTYRFTLADGNTVEAKGDDEIVYDGEVHTAANLFDALKEGYYGKL